MKGLVAYIGFGMLADPYFMRCLLGNSKIKGTPAKIEGCQLGIQGIKDVTNKTVAEGIPSPRQILLRGWGDEFRAYVAIKDDTGKKTIQGVLWLVSEKELQIIAEWQMVSLGWQQRHEVEVTLPDGSKVKAMTELLANGQTTSQEVPGTDYALHLNDFAQACKLAIETRHMFLANGDK